MPTFLTVKESAAFLRLSAGTVYRLLADGLVPCLRVGTGRGRILIREDDLENYVREGRNVEPVPQVRQPRIQLKHLRLSSSAGG